MGQTFRLAIGNCSCNNPNLKQGSELQRVCESVKARIQKFKKFTFEQIQSLPDEEEDLAWVQGKRVIFTLIKEPVEDFQLVVVRAFMYTWKWPTFISFNGVGHVVAEGIVVSNNGEIEDAPEDYLWSFR